MKKGQININYAPRNIAILNKRHELLRAERPQRPDSQLRYVLSINIIGSGLAELTAANFTLPQGSTLSITSQSDTMIAATISNAQAGAFKVTHNLVGTLNGSSSSSPIITASSTTIGTITIVPYSSGNNHNPIDTGN